jgi:hypothetical protein
LHLSREKSILQRKTNSSIITDARYQWIAPIQTIQGCNDKKVRLLADQPTTQKFNSPGYPELLKNS